MTTEAARPRGPPPAGERNFEINLGWPCNNDCVFCSNADTPRKAWAWAPREQVVAEIARAASEGYRALSLLGGEVTLYPDVAGVVAAARGLGFTRIALTTNGRPLARPGALAALLDAGVTRISLSIHSHRADVEDAICARAGAFAQKVSGIAECVAAARAGRLRDGFATNTCLHGRVAGQLDETVRFLRDRGVTDLRLNSLRPERGARGSRELVPRFDALMPELVQLVHLNERSYRLTMTFGDIPLCMWPPALLSSTSFLRRYLGELRDLDTSVQVLGDQGLASKADRFRWRDRRQEELKTFVPACDGCEARGRCEGVWANYVEIYGGDELHALRPRAVARP